MVSNGFLKIAITLSAFFSASTVNAGMATKGAVIVTAPAEKELYIPDKVYRIPENNDYNSNESDYSYSRMVQSKNIAIFWHKEYGDDPAANPDENKRFNVHDALKELERFYNYYVNDLKIVHRKEIH